MLCFGDRAWEGFTRLMDAGHFGRVAVFSDDPTDDVRKKRQRQTNVPVRVLHGNSVHKAHANGPEERRKYGWWNYPCAHEKRPTHGQNFVPNVCSSKS